MHGLLLEAYQREAAKAAAPSKSPATPKKRKNSAGSENTPLLAAFKKRAIMRSNSLSSNFSLSFRQRRAPVNESRGASRPILISAPTLVAHTAVDLTDTFELMRIRDTSASYPDLLATSPARAQSAALLQTPLVPARNAAAKLSPSLRPPTFAASATTPIYDPPESPTADDMKLRKKNTVTRKPLPEEPASTHFRVDILAVDAEDHLAAETECKQMVIEAGGKIVDMVYPGGFCYDMREATAANPLDDGDLTERGGIIYLSTYTPIAPPKWNPLRMHPVGVPEWKGCPPLGVSVKSPGVWANSPHAPPTTRQDKVWPRARDEMTKNRADHWIGQVKRSTSQRSSQVRSTPKVTPKTNGYVLTHLPSASTTSSQTLQEYASLNENIILRNRDTPFTPSPLSASTSIFALNKPLPPSPSQLNNSISICSAPTSYAVNDDEIEIKEAYVAKLRKRSSVHLLASNSAITVGGETSTLAEEVPRKKSTGFRKALRVLGAGVPDRPSRPVEDEDEDREHAKRRRMWQSPSAYDPVVTMGRVS